MSDFEKFKVLGYIRPAEVFHTLDEWQHIAEELIALQATGLDTRGGEISCSTQHSVAKMIWNDLFRFLASIGAINWM